MKVLLIKTSSLGDVVHTFPALAEAKLALPDLRVDWVVEEAFADLVRVNSQVERVIPVAWRRWRRELWRPATWKQWWQFKKSIRESQYDLVIDAQGLVKSAWFSRLARGVRVGYDWQSAREPLASWCYQRRINVDKEMHAVLRTRELLAKILGYPLQPHAPKVQLQTRGRQGNAQPTVFLLHGTTWATKHWPTENWLELASLALRDGFAVQTTWGNAFEQQQAEKMQQAVPELQVLPKSSLAALASILASADGAIAVDTGLAHLVASLGVPSLSLYGPTDPSRTGTIGYRQQHLASTQPCAPCKKAHCRLIENQLSRPPCMHELNPALVWQTAKKLFSEGG